MPYSTPSSPHTPNTPCMKRVRRFAVVEATLTDEALQALADIRANPPMRSHHDSKGRRQAICPASVPNLLPSLELLRLGNWPTTQEAKEADLFDDNLNSMEFDLRGEDQEDLQSMYVQMFAQLGLGRTLNVPPATVAAFARDVFDAYDAMRHNEDSGAKPGAYHNAEHAWDVTQALFSMLSQTAAGQLLDDHGKLVLLVAALQHDMGHGGLNNGFLAASNDELAARFGTDGTLERYHAHLAVRLLEEERDGGLLSGMTGVASARLINEVEQVILATDMAKHRRVLDNAHQFVDEWNSTPEHLPVGPSRSALMALLLKCADISNVARPEALSVFWSERLMEEFHRQGDLEKQLGLPVSMNCNRDTDTSITKLTGGFIDFLARDAFELLASAIPDSAYLLDAVNRNRALYN